MFFRRALVAAAIANLCLGLATISFAGDQEDLCPGLVSYWAFDTDATDGVGTSDGVINGATHVPECVVDGCLDFDGVDDDVVVASPPSGTFETISFWAYLDHSSLPTDYAGMPMSFSQDIYRAVGLGNGTGFRLDDETFWWNREPGLIDGYESIIPAGWHHYALIYDADQSRYDLFFDGTSVPVGRGSDGSPGAFQNETEIRFGARVHTYPNRLTGRLDEIGIWNRALAASEVAALYNGGAGIQNPCSSNDDGLVAHYTFDVPGDPGADAVNGFHATTVVGVTQVSGVTGQAGFFTSGWMQLPDVTAFDLLGGDFTFAVFVKGSVNPNNRNWFTKANPVHHRYGLGGNDLVGFGFNGAGTPASSKSSAFDNTWHHLAGVKRGSTIELWFDGVLEDSSIVDTNFVDDGGIAIGRDGQCCEYFNGFMDDARIYNRALTQFEIVELSGVSVTAEISYVALGDSYSSGQGAGSYGDTDSETNSCHRSEFAWSSDRPGDEPRASAPAIAEQVDRSLFACNGALIPDLYTDYQDNHDGKNPDEIPQLNHDQLDEADMISITIGGNDVGFAKILLMCLFEPNCVRDDFRPFGTSDSLSAWVAANISRLVASGDLRDAYTDIKGPENTPTFVLGYPQVISNPIHDSLPLVDDICNLLDVAYDSEELDAFETWTNDLNSAIACAASEAGVHHVWVDFEGHEACGFWRDWIRTLRTSDLNEFISAAERFHPNMRGQERFAEELNDYIDIFQYDGAPLIPDNPIPMAPGESIWCQLLMNEKANVVLPSLGELVVAPPDIFGCSEDRYYVPEQNIAISGSGFSASTSVEISAQSADGSFSELLSTISTDAFGDLAGTISLPSGITTPSSVMLSALGTGVDSSPRLLVGSIGLVDSLSFDSDSDGITDSCDNCPDDFNADQENSDGDYLGDACDPCPNDFEDDWDQDGLCSDSDPCPLDPSNTIDATGACFNVNGIFQDGLESGETTAWSNTVP